MTADEHERYAFRLQVAPDRLDDYARRHAAVWPEMLQALHDSGWHGYSLFAAADGLLVGYVEAESLVAAQAAMAETEVNARWQASMAEFFTSLDGTPPDEGLELLTQVFNLERQLGLPGGGRPAAADASPGPRVTPLTPTTPASTTTTGTTTTEETS
ncbi:MULTISPECIES: L-rhamnose mutarotase [unclassified Frigoribacterium]|uniref:L-rhamnose mutarotase n=1 Tax=unclassified Frigoribacterium TaxID=2627005 RepID=UPI0009EB8118|nr:MULTISPECIES: L-rhamnose mutarotase [unclassified Frigoribacterium]MBD8728108.1 L-rhamnose mutarotase [Frigoribacterium sp. CFBP 13707]